MSRDTRAPSAAYYFRGLVTAAAVVQRRMSSFTSPVPAHSKGSTTPYSQLSAALGLELRLELLRVGDAREEVHLHRWALCWRRLGPGGLAEGAGGVW